ncbi:winged helix-turn-helix transcriptional regulator [Microbispora sp. SCL1-1]|uniref:winged helix-turn-helix domain-containing protein n=1 Tax=unclassified Microbispora TaxID=2614687 RepID=UPI001157C2E6|nr:MULTISPECIES: winged helix-turn-helix domain-containing protein [unclassified Microbispora]NJP30213.1 winged helix-turn-helix transcriptional regulator [Microbispora sp. CL1-1]TQS02394.1 winged helix-turn-helix transcriptional regulator [Microbispora sp. SCL1-1]
MRDGWLTGGQVYRQIADRLRDRVTTGTYPPGTALPSETVLAAEFRVARNTVRRACRTLEDERLIVTVPSLGRIVLSADGGPAAVPYRYQVIAGALRERIERGEFGPGAALPSEAELRWLYAASRNTVRMAFAQLEREGLVVSIQGKGRFVRTTPETS